MEEGKFRRFFESSLVGDEKEVTLRGSEVHHMKNVLKVSEGDSVSLFNGKGVELIGTVKEIGRDNVHITIDKKLEPRAESRVDVTLLQGFVRGEKNELIIQKATELGVKKIKFYASPWTKIKVKEDDRGKKEDKLFKVAVDAAKQCERSFVPEIKVYSSMEEAIDSSSEGFKIIFYEEERAKSLRKVLSNTDDIDSGVAVLIGPEGGFSSEEVIYAKSKGFISAGLGLRTLRSETAAISAVTILQYEFGYMGG